jgi:hypothetical protein
MISGFINISNEVGVVKSVLIFVFVPRRTHMHKRDGAVSLELFSLRSVSQRNISR